MPTATHAARRELAAWLERTRESAWDADPHLGAITARLRPDARAGLIAFGAEVARRLDPLARETNRDENLPRLSRFDDIGRRTEHIVFHPSYHALGRAVYATGVMSAYTAPGNELQTLLYTYLYAQNGEAGHACPLACTAGMIKILQADARATPDAAWAPLRATWLARLLDPDYDRHFHASQFLTEIQGGSDVGANAVIATEDEHGWRLAGEKWFCSVADADLFLVTARPEGATPGTGGLAAYVVPRLLADGAPNGFAIRRLKTKLGTRSMASAEIDFDGARAWPVGDFKRVVEVVLDTSRLYNAACSAGMLQRCAREATAYAEHRHAFGRPIGQFAGVARKLQRLDTEAHAARGLTFLLADLVDRLATGDEGPDDRGAHRMLVNLNKYWTSYACTSACRDAIEVFGGNGAIEDFSVLPRLLRDSIVCEAWEGGHDVLCAQALRDSRRLGLHEPMLRWLERLARSDETRAALGAAAEAWRAAVADPRGEAQIRDVADALRRPAQAAALEALGTDAAVVTALLRRPG